MSRPLTARGVRAILTRSGVDHSALTITDDPAEWRDVMTGVAHTSIRIEGPKEPRRDASHVLFDRGFWLAPYPDHDDWHR